MTLALVIIFLLGFSVCWHLAGEHDRRRELMLARRDEELRATTARLWGDQHPVDVTAARETRGTRADGGIPGQHHNHLSSGVLLHRSESPS